MKKLFIFLAFMTFTLTSLAIAKDYDLVIKNGRVIAPETIADKGTYTEPNQPAIGVQSVLLNDVAVVADGKLVEDAAPGKPIRRAIAEKMDSVKCPEVRPEMCTMDYNPVCGSLSDGSFKTYSNGCNACSDPKVTTYSQGECK